MKVSGRFAGKSGLKRGGGRVLEGDLAEYCLKPQRIRTLRELAISQSTCRSDPRNDEERGAESRRSRRVEVGVSSSSQVVLFARFPIKTSHTSEFIVRSLSHRGGVSEQVYRLPL